MTMSRARISPANRPCRYLQGYFRRLRFSPEWANHQGFDGLVDIDAAIEHGGNRLSDRHIDAVFGCNVHQNGCRENAFRKFATATCLSKRLGQRAALAERDAKREIARLSARARQNQIAEAGK